MVNEVDYKIWDIKTITLNDFSVEISITDELWKDFTSKNPQAYIA